MLKRLFRNIAGQKMMLKTGAPGPKNPTGSFLDSTKNPPKSTKNSTNNGTKNPQTPKMGLIRGRAQGATDSFLTVAQQFNIRRGEVALLKTTPEPRWLSVIVRATHTRRLKILTGKEFLTALAHADGLPVMVEENRGRLFYQFQLPKGLQTNYNLAQLPKGAVGLGTGKAPVRPAFSDTVPHFGVFGQTGSGKTTGTQAELIQLCRAAGPDMLKLIILDAKGDLGQFHNLAHLAAPVAHRPVEIDAAFGIVSREFQHRLGLSADDRQAQPRFVLVIDEAGLVVKGHKDRIEFLTTLAQVGRGLKMHLIFGAQNPTEPGADYGPILNELAGVFIGRVKSPQLSYHFTGQGGLRAHELQGRGDFIYHVPGATRRFQFALPGRGDFERLPRADVAPPPAPPPVVVPTVAADDVQPVGGRPVIVADDPRLIAWYLVEAAYQHGWKKARSLHRVMVKAGLLPPVEGNRAESITETMHNVYQPFTRQIAEQMYLLKGASDGQS